jgi:hypothetical protein
MPIVSSGTHKFKTYISYIALFRTSIFKNDRNYGPFKKLRPHLTVQIVHVNVLFLEDITQ